MTHLPSITRLYAPWMTEAACAGADPELFYAGAERPDQHAARITKAKSYCRRCPVRANCLLFAIENRDEYGLFGGLTAEERAKMKKGRTA